LALIIMLLLTRPLLAGWLNGNTVQQATALFALLVTAVALYGIVLHLLQLSEMNIISDKIKSRLRRK